MKQATTIESGELIDARWLAAVEDLDLVARWLVEGFLHGRHRSPYVGFSVDFVSHREYIPGDDLRHLNWKLLGRHDRLYIKQYDAETNVDLHLVLDVSGSMTVGDESHSKLRYATWLCAALIHLAAHQRDAVGLTIVENQVVEHLEARANSDHRMLLLSRLAVPRKHPRVDSTRAWHEAAELMPRRGLVVVITDAYYESDDLLSSLDHFRHFGHDLLLFQVLAPVEYRMNAEGPIQLVDAETGATYETQAHEIRDSFQEAVREWVDRLHHDCRARSMDHLCLVTDEPLEKALAAYCYQRDQIY